MTSPHLPPRPSSFPLSPHIPPLTHVPPRSCLAQLDLATLSFFYSPSLSAPSYPASPPLKSILLASILPPTRISESLSQLGTGYSGRYDTPSVAAVAPVPPV
eukprot:6190278-Pleurochrysis_carterae.AAC.2